MDEFTRVGAARNAMVDGVEFYIIRRSPHEEERQIGTVVMEPLPESEESVWHPPAFWVTMHNAKKLMDDLWNAGVRPTEMSETEGALTATKEHLQDMRDIAFRSIDTHYILNVQDKSIDE